MEADSDLGRQSEHEYYAQHSIISTAFRDLYV